MLLSGRSAFLLSPLQLRMSVKLQVGNHKLSILSKEILVNGTLESTGGWRNDLHAKRSHCVNRVIRTVIAEMGRHIQSENETVVEVVMW